MTALAQALADYLALRRTGGFKLEGAGRDLPRFVAYMEAQGAPVLTTALALAWASAAPGQGGARRLEEVRGFARYLQALDPATEVPPTRLLPTTKSRPVPYLYSEVEVCSLMAAARELAPPLWAATCEAVIGLLWVSGLRPGEALRLGRKDIDWDQGVLTVWFTKFGKSRHVPLTPSTLAALHAYANMRDQMCPPGHSFFVSPEAGRVNGKALNFEFVGLLATAGVPAAPTPHRPRLGDMRHSFAVRTVLGWYRAGDDVQALLPRLSTFLGHVNPAATYWYLSAAPELLALAAERLGTDGPQQ